ncbi:hypothetical protein FHS19_003318 [Paenibacillus rhizosphaerae]|uniref:Uncharacterized protein n=1 Tax=Paenibacillus rhizosphaerae TaxID=297318 RepID=A0A839TNZ0_9BACL|nr:hypothetical protein [Paenibacillus rhizosphaerae]
MAEFVIMGILPDIATDLNVSIPTTGSLITGLLSRCRADRANSSFS